MMRHPALQDLSRDHHFVLRFSQRIRRALEAHAREEELGPLVDELLGYLRTDMLAHFQEEDGFVLPIATSMGSRELSAIARQVEEDHRWLRSTFAELARRRNAGAPVLNVLADLEPRMTQNVRFEEERLFEGLQKEVDDHILRNMWAASFRFRSQNRAPAACTVRPPVKVKRS